MNFTRLHTYSMIALLLVSYIPNGLQGMEEILFTDDDVQIEEAFRLGEKFALAKGQEKDLNKAQEYFEQVVDKNVRDEKWFWSCLWLTKCSLGKEDEVSAEEYFKMANSCDDFDEFWSNTAKAGKKDIVELLIEKGADIEAKSKKGTTVFMFAVVGGHADVCELLIEKGADIHAKNNDGLTALILAGGFGHYDVCELLIRMGADINYKHPRTTQTACTSAVQRGHYKVCALLIGKGDDKDAKSIDDKTALLMYAAKKGHYHVCRILIKKDADIDAKNNEGETPLMLAASNGHYEICEFLIKSGADIHAEREDGRTVFRIVAFRGNMKIIKLLAEKGDRDAQKHVDAEYINGWLDKELGQSNFLRNLPF